MKIERGSSFKVKPFTIVILIVGLLLSLFLLVNGNLESTKKSAQVQNEETDDIDRLTVLHAITYPTLFKTKECEVYSDEILTIYLANTSGIPKLIYKYTVKPEGRVLTDHFLVHVYLKDTTKLIGKQPFANASFKESPDVIKIGDSTYYVFQKNLVANNYNDSYIPFKNIAFIKTGRLKPEVGLSLELQKLSLENIPESKLHNSLEKINVTIGQEAFNKIKAKRENALRNGVLISEDDDIVNGRIALNNNEPQKVELRLKGDWPDHLKHESKWSYRFILKGENTFNGMRKFSIQHPAARHYLWEWLYNKAIKDNGIIGLRYDFANVNLTVKGSAGDTNIPMGLMAVEESFDKILIENNKKREGIILAFDESLVWKDREKQHELELERKSQSRELHSLDNAQIKIFNENKVLSDPELIKQFETAKDLLDGLRQGTYKISEVFDVDRLATFVALSNLFGGSHGLVWHNLRIYYNPITNKLEPIAFDSNSGVRLDKILEYPMSENDSLFKEKVLEKLKLVSSTKFITDLLNRYSTELESLKIDLYTEFDATLDIDILTHNSNFIKKKINPAVLITANLLSYDDTQMKIEINNVSGQSITLEHLIDFEGRILGLNKNEVTIKEKTSAVVNFTLSDYFVNAFVSKKNKKGTFQYPKDVAKLRITHYIKGIGHKKSAMIKPYGKNPSLENSVAYYKKTNKENFREFSFIEEQPLKILKFKEGTYQLTKDLVIPSGYTIDIAPGFKLDFKNNASIRSYATFICNGTKEKAIHFYSSDNTGGGIFISNTEQKCQVSYSNFENLSNPKTSIWSVSGAVNFHESDVTIAHSSFKNNRCEDGLNIIRSSFTMTDTTFEGAQSDAFDGDFVTGSIELCTFLNSGNDAIDVSGSELLIKDLIIKNSLDKGISAGENSTITGENIRVFGGEIGVVSKDLSRMNLTNLSIIDTRLGISAFQKKTEYGVASIQISNLTLINNELEYLIENGSSLMIDTEIVETVSNNVIDQMYGKEYGKSSR